MSLMIVTLAEHPTHLRKTEIVPPAFRRHWTLVWLRLIQASSRMPQHRRRHRPRYLHNERLNTLIVHRFGGIKQSGAGMEGSR